MVENVARQIISDVDEFLERSLRHREPYETTVLGRTLVVHPQVMSPLYSHSSTFFVNNWDIRPGMRVMDMGCGCGILSVFAAYDGASHVTAVDINPFAVENTHWNIGRHDLGATISVRRSNLFEAVDPAERFDRILFNAPYWNRPADPGIPLTLSVFDQDYRASRGLLENAHRFLAPGGQVLAVVGLQDDVRLLHTIVREAGWHILGWIREKRGHPRVLLHLEPVL